MLLFRKYRLTRNSIIYGSKTLCDNFNTLLYFNYEFQSDRTSGRPYRLNIVEKCGIAVSFARGKMLTPKNFPPSCGPRILYSSHKTTTEVIATTNIAERYAMRRANIFTSLPDSAPQSRAKFLCRKPQEFALCRRAANKPRTDQPQDP